MPRRLAKKERELLYRILVLRDGDFCQDCKLTPGETLQGLLQIDHVNENPDDFDESNLALRCRSCNVAKGNRARWQAAKNQIPTTRPDDTRRQGYHNTTPYGGHTQGVPHQIPTTRNGTSESANGQISELSDEGEATAAQAGKRQKETENPDDAKTLNPGVGKWERNTHTQTTPGSANMNARRREIDSENGTPEMQANGMYEDIFRQWLYDYVVAHGSIAKRDAVRAGAELTGASIQTIQRYADKITSLIGPLKYTKDDAGIRIIVLR